MSTIANRCYAQLVRAHVALDDGTAVAELIRAARVHSGLTQAAFAERLGTKQSVVSRWERGGDEPRLSTLTRILRVAGLSVVLDVAPDDVDRAQLRQNLAMTPSERLASVTNISRMRATAKRVD